MIMPFSTALVAALLLAPTAEAFMGPSPKVVLRGPQHQKQTTTKHPTAASRAPSTTRIFLEDWVAEMIDAEIWRQGHRKDFESAWMEKNRAAIVQNLNPGSGAVPSESMLTMDDPKEFVQHARDVRMAKEDPQRYCADRCITTGNCDVYEDLYVLPTIGWLGVRAGRSRFQFVCSHTHAFVSACSFHMSAQQVIEFCNDCVISDGEEPCDIPEAFYDDGSGDAGGNNSKGLQP
jgi:hypothetical protein